ncbi:MAG: AMP-binding protein [Gammaproteobacteria bacterium]|nr:AMP-binding protein [Gammaproteobacteria bacterium]
MNPAQAQAAPQGDWPTLGALPARAARRWPDREALTFGELRVSFSDFEHEVRRVAKALLASGINRGDRVAVWMMNSPQWLYAMFAVPMVGAAIVPLNTRYRSDDIAYALAQSRSALLLTQTRSGPVEFARMLTLGMSELDGCDARALELAKYPYLKQIVMLDEAGSPGMQLWSDWLTTGEAVDDAALDRRLGEVGVDDDMMIMYTSGTTGHPKGALHSHRVVRNTLERMRLYGVTEDDVQMSYLPLFHIYGFSELAMASLLTGSRQVLMDMFDAEQALDLAERERATMLHGFDAHWLDLLRAQEGRQRKLSIRLNTCPSGMKSSAAIARRAETVFGTMLSGFGMSETWCFITCNRPDDTLEQRTEASGTPMQGYACRIVDPQSGAAKPDGQPGELLVRGYAQMKGYFDKPEETARIVDADGWIHTGDMCLRRPDGHFVFMGRYRDILKVGGENVSPAEVEAFLLGMEGINDAAVVGVPDARLQEVVVAFVVPRLGAALDAERLIQNAHGRIASFKIPRHVFFEDALPMTPSGKVRKVELRALARRRLGLPETDGASKR